MKWTYPVASEHSNYSFSLIFYRCFCYTNIHIWQSHMHTDTILCIYRCIFQCPLAMVMWFMDLSLTCAFLFKMKMFIFDSKHECRKICTSYHWFTMCISIGYCSNGCYRMSHFLNIDQCEKHDGSVLFGHVKKLEQTTLWQPYLLFVGICTALCTALCTVAIWLLETNLIKINTKVKIFLMNCVWNNSERINK